MKRLVIVLTIFLSIISLSYAQESKQQVSLNLSFIAPNEGQELPVAKPFRCKGNYTPVDINTSTIHVWLFLMDEFLDGYYIQGPVLLLRNGTWDGRITPGERIVKLVAIQANDEAHKAFTSWLKNKTFGKQYELPKGTEIIATIDIRS